MVARAGRVHVLRQEARRSLVGPYAPGRRVGPHSRASPRARHPALSRHVPTSERSGRARERPGDPARPAGPGDGRLPRRTRRRAAAGAAAGALRQGHRRVDLAAPVRDRRRGAAGPAARGADRPGLRDRDRDGAADGAHPRLRRPRHRPAAAGGADDAGAAALSQRRRRRRPARRRAEERGGDRLRYGRGRRTRTFGARGADDARVRRDDPRSPSPWAPAPRRWPVCRGSAICR